MFQLPSLSHDFLSLKSIPEREVRWSDPRLRPAWAVLSIAAVVALAFLPKTMIVGDEVFYAGQARTMLHGRIVPIGTDPLPAGGWYPPGWPSALMLGALFGFRGMFLVPLAFHLLGGALFARILVRRDLPAVAAALYLFHPVFWNLSRTLMSDMPTAAMFLAAIDGWEQRRAAQSGGGLFMMIASRLASIFAIAGLVLAVLPRLRARWRDAAWATGSCVLGAMAIGFANLVEYGGPFKSSYGAAGASMFGTRDVLANFSLYGAGLLLLPPCSLALVMWRPRMCDRWVLAAVPVLLIALVFSFHDRSARLLEALVVGQRYIVPAHVALLVGTAGLWAKLPFFRWQPAVVVGGGLAAIVQVVMTLHAYSRYEPALAAMKTCAPTRVAYNSNAAKVALSLDAKEYVDINGDSPLNADVVVFAERAPTNQGSETSLSYRPSAALRAERDKCRKIGEFSVVFLSAKCVIPGSLPACDLDLEP